MDLRLARVIRAAPAVAVPVACPAPAAGLQPPRTLVNFDTSTPNDVRLRVTATDAAGNSRTLTRTIRVRP